MSKEDENDGLEDLQDLLKDYKDEDNNEKTKPKENLKTKKKNGNKERKNVCLVTEKVIFGDKPSLLKNMAKAVGGKLSDDDNDNSSSVKEKRKAEKRKPVWTDADDEEIQICDLERNKKHGYSHLRQDKSYKEHLTKHFERVIGAQPKWAQMEKAKRPDDVDSDDDELLRTVGFLEKPTGSTLLPNIVDYKSVRHLNYATQRSEGEIVSIQFHPTSTAALVAGENGLATIYAVDGRTNDKLHSIHLNNFPLKCVRIAPCGTKAIFGSVKPYYYSYDLLTATETRFFLPRETRPLNKFNLSPCGRYMASSGIDGELHLFDANSNELMYTFKQENKVADIRFTGDSNRIICNSTGPNASIFSLRMRRIEHSFIDDGCVKGSAIELSPNQRLLATGSKEGVVNVYDFENLQTTKTPKPLKTFLNLRTGISDLKFNHSSEMLAMCSGIVNNAVRLAHFPSATVYSNFPGARELGPIRTMEFSPNSGYLALGSRTKTANLFRLKHFNNY